LSSGEYVAFIMFCSPFLYVLKGSPSIKKLFSPSQDPGEKRGSKTGILIAASLHIGHDGYLRRAVCK